MRVCVRAGVSYSDTHCNDSPLSRHRLVDSRWKVALAQVEVESRGKANLFLENQESYPGIVFWGPKNLQLYLFLRPLLAIDRKIIIIGGLRLFGRHFAKNG